MEKQLRAYVVELIGTFALVFLTAALICAAQARVGPDAPPLGLIGIAVGIGCIVAVLLTATTRVSPGCLNPAVPVVHWVTGRFTSKVAAISVFMQLLGAAVAGLLIIMIFSDDVLSRAMVGTPRLQQALRGGDGDISLGALAAGVAIELGLTFLLMLALLVTVLDEQRAPYGALLAGIASTVVVLIGFRLTGGSANPARWFGTVIWHPSVSVLKTKSSFDDHLVQWMGPLLGALLAGIVYTGLIQSPKDHQ